MRSSKLKLSRARIAALAIGLGAMGSLALAPASYAAAPNAGTACVNTLGKISGRGSTLQLWLQYDLMGAYSTSCGVGGILADPAANGGDITDPGSAIYSLPGGETYGVPCPSNAANTCDWMTAYNYPSAQILGSSGANAAIGSGAGETTIGCRAEAFSGTDIPVTSAQLGNSTTANTIDGPVVAAGGALLGKNCDPVNGATVLTSPFAPQPQGGANGTGGTSYPNPGDQPCGTVVAGNGCVDKNGVMVFPIGLSAVSIYTNLPSSCFSGSAPQLTTTDMQMIWGGTWLTWNQVAGDAASGIVSPCDVSTTTSGADTLPVTTLEVVSITGLPAGGGTVTVPSSNDGTQTLTYTGEGTTSAACGSAPPCLTGVSGGTSGATIVSGAEVTSNTALTITRVVRSDNSGTTQSFDNYLADAFGYSTATCDSAAGDDAVTFGQLQNNQVAVGSDVHWPGLGTPTGTCSTVSDSQGAGGPAQITAAEGLSGSIGYADYSDTKHDTNNFTSTIAGNTLSQFGLETSTGTTNVAPSVPGAGIGASNCTDSSSLPAGGANGSVGIAAPGKGWDLTAQTTPNQGPDDVAYGAEGSAYPICSLTWDFVWTGIDGNNPPAPTVAAVGYTSPAATMSISSVAGLPNSGPFTIGGTASSYTGLGTTAAACPQGPPCLTGVTAPTSAASSVLTFAVGNGGPEPNLTPDQRQTLWDYFTFVMSPGAQTTEASAGYAALPTLWQNTIRSGFQGQF